MPVTRMLLCIALLGLLGGCGFHLRGTHPLAEDIQSVSVAGPTEITRAVKRQMLASSIQLTESAAAAGAWQLLIREEERNRRTISFDPTVEAAEHELNMTTEFRLVDPQGLLIMGPVTLRTTRTLVHDKNRLLGSGAEASLLYEEMAQENASRIMRMLERLSSEDIRAAREAHAAMEAGSES